jgi:hypothetical protein
MTTTDNPQDRRDKLATLTAKSQTTPSEDEAAAAVKNATPSPARSSASDTVTVACKLPNGLILRVFKMVERPESGPMHSRTVKVAEVVGEPITVHGPAYAFGNMPPYMIVAGYALTPNVPKEFFETWFEQNKDSTFVQNKLVFAFESHDHVVGQAKEYEKNKSGMEPVDPEDLPRAFRGIRKFNAKEEAA